MVPRHAVTDASIEEYDRTYRAGGLRAMASPHVHYHDPLCPHPGCGHRMEWIDFRLEKPGDKARIDDPLVRSFWSGAGFAGRCPSCGGWVRFTTLAMEAIGDAEAGRVPRLPDDWQAVAQFA